MPAAFLQDLKYAFRIMRRSPRDTFIAAAILGLGIGANTAMFSAVNHVLWRPFPFPDEARLIRLREMVVGADRQPHPFNMSSRAILAVREHATDVFDAVVAMRGEDMTLLGSGAAFGARGDLPERVSVVLQTVGFEQTLQVQPAAGRALAADEERLGIDAAVALVSDRMANARFGGPAQALGAHVRLDDRTFTIVGVMPPQYAFPYEAQFWVPWRLDPSDRGRDFAVWAHTRAGATPKQIADAMTRVAADLRSDPRGGVPGYGIEIRTIRQNLLGDQQRPLLALTEIVGVMLLIAAVNVATLLLARSVARQREFAIRAAIGQSKTRHVSQLVAESLALAGLGCAAGLLLTSWLGPLTVSLVPTVLSGQLGLSTPKTDWRVAAFAVAVSLASAIVAGVVPAFGSWRSNPQAALAGGGRSMTTGRRGRMLFNALIVSETALTLVLLAGAGLIIRNFVRLQTQPLGFDAHGLLAVELTPSASAYPDGARRSALLRRIIEEVSAAPGVKGVGVTSVNPLGGGTWSAFVTSETNADPDATIGINHRLITPGLFEAMGIVLLRGRSFTPADRAGTQPVAIVSDRLAKRLWPGQDPIGLRIRSARPGAPWTTVVGIAANVADSHEPDVPRETWYLPFDQNADTPAAEHVYLMVRDGEMPLASVANVQRAAARVDDTLAPYNPVAMDDYFSTSIARERVSAAMMIGFAVFGLMLAALGVYGVMAVSVSQRTAEFGIRLALGARASDIVSLAASRSIAMIAVGVGVGTAIAIVLNRFVAHLLIEVGRFDVSTLAAAAILIVAAAVAACLVPAIRAGQVDPVSVLNQ